MLQTGALGRWMAVQLALTGRETETDVYWIPVACRMVMRVLSAMNLLSKRWDMEHRFLGASGFKVPVLSFGTGTFGGKGEFFGAWGQTDVAEARRVVDICLDAGLTMFDSADVY